MADFFNSEYTPEQLDAAKAKLDDVPEDVAGAILLNLMFLYPEAPVPMPDEVDGNPVTALKGLVDEYPNEIAEATVVTLYQLDPYAATAAIAGIVAGELV